MELVISSTQSLTQLRVSDCFLSTVNSDKNLYACSKTVRIRFQSVRIV